MKRNTLATLMLVASIGLSTGSAELMTTSASAVGPPMRTFVTSGSIVSVNVPLHQFVVLSGTTRYSIMTTSATQFTFNQVKCSLSSLQPGYMVTTRGMFRAHYRVALQVQARSATPVPISTLPATTVLTSALNNALSQERYALATYQNVVAKFGSINPFKNIITAETQHVATITALMTAHGVPVPSGSTAGSVAPSTIKAACQQGVTLETGLISMYANGIASAKDYPDVVRVFSNLLDVSQSSHLLAFLRCS